MSQRSADHLPVVSSVDASVSKRDRRPGHFSCSEIAGGFHQVRAADLSVTISGDMRQNQITTVGVQEKAPNGGSRREVNTRTAAWFSNLVDLPSLFACGCVQAAELTLGRGREHESLLD